MTNKVRCAETATLTGVLTSITLAGVAATIDGVAQRKFATAFATTATANILVCVTDNVSPTTFQTFYASYDGNTPGTLTLSSTFLDSSTGANITFGGNPCTVACTLVLDPNGLIPASAIAPCALVQSAVASVAAPTAAVGTAEQCGLALSYTPRTTGKTLILIQATVIDTGGTGAGLGLIVQGSYGTGAAPAVHAAATGTVFGQKASWEATATVTATDVSEPLIFKSTITLTAGTTYWIDLQQTALGTTTKCSLSLLDITIQEFY